MRMLRPSLGECLDRITVLDLKIANCHAIKRPDAAVSFQEEHDGLTGYMKTAFPMHVPETANRIQEVRDKIFAINSQLWKCEDDIRDLIRIRRSGAAVDTKAVVDVAFLIPELNDERARLVSEANAIVGDTHKEKVYQL